MKQEILRFVPLLLIFVFLVPGCISLKDEPVILPERNVIVLPDSPDPIELFAAEELSEHLRVATGDTVRIRRLGELESESSAYRLMVGFRAPGDNEPFASQEAGYSVHADGLYLYGDDSVPSVEGEAATDFQSSSGVLFAVYEFLERECGIRWIMPGPLGTICLKPGKLTLRPGRVDWEPEFTPRMMRPLKCERGGSSGELHSGLAGSLSDCQGWAGGSEEFMLWLRRRRMSFAGSVSGGEPLAGREFVLPGLFFPPGHARAYFDYCRRRLKRRSTGLDMVLPGVSWWMSGLERHALAGLLVNPNERFDTLKKEFCAMFGLAGRNVMQYYDYWEEHAGTSDFRIDDVPNSTESGMATRESCFQFAGEFLPEHFSESLAFLHDGLECDLSDIERIRLQKFIVAHEHSRVTVEAMLQRRALADDGDDLQMVFKAGSRVLAERRSLAEHLGGPVSAITASEINLGDVTGVGLAELFKDLEALPHVFDHRFYRLDPEDLGVREEWYAVGPDGLAGWAESEPEAIGAADNEGIEADGALWCGAVFELREEWKDRGVFLIFLEGTAGSRVYLNGELLRDCVDEERGMGIPVSVRLDSAFRGAPGTRQVLAVRVVGQTVDTACSAIRHTTFAVQARE